MPGLEKWGEISSCSSCTDFQAGKAVLQHFKVVVLDSWGRTYLQGDVDEGQEMEAMRDCWNFCLDWKDARLCSLFSSLVGSH